MAGAVAGLAVAARSVAGRCPPAAALRCLAALAAAASPAALATNPGCWRHGYDAAYCCGPPAGGPCWGADPEARRRGRRSCCELGGYLLDAALAASPAEAVAAGGCAGAAGRYHGPADYIPNARPEDYVDDGCAGQAPVYGLALRFAREAGLGHAVEVGGGAGEWSSLLLQQGLGLTLLDRAGPNLRNATARLAAQPALAGRWSVLEWDIDASPPPALPQLPPVIAIAADVVEHLLDPLALLSFVGGLLRSGAADVAVVSTPDRDAFYDWRYHRGPPTNPAHVREWSSAEFARLLTCQGLPVAAMFEVEGTLLAVLGRVAAHAEAMAEAVWASPEASSLELRWRRLL